MDKYSEERKWLIGLIAYRFAEICESFGIDGLWIGNMTEISAIADEYDFTHTLDERDFIDTDVVYDDVDRIAYRLAVKEKNK